MKLKTKVFIYQFVCFALLFVASRFLLAFFFELSRIWLPLLSALIASVLAPQFRVIQTQEGEKIMMRWIFVKGVKTLN